MLLLTPCRNYPASGKVLVRTGVVLQVKDSLVTANKSTIQKAQLQEIDVQVVICSHIAEHLYPVCAVSPKLLGSSLPDARHPLTSKEVEDAKLHGTQHGQEALSDQEGEQEVACHRDGVTTAACLQGLHLRAHQPGQRPPGPGKASNEDADEHNDHNAGRLRQVAISCEHGAQNGPDHNLSNNHLNTTLKEPEATTSPGEKETGRKHSDKSFTLGQLAAGIGFLYIGISCM